MIREKIKAELVAAMKEHNEAKVSTLRMIGSALKDKDIAARPSGKTDGISDDEILSMFQSMIKQRKESIELYEKGGRADLADKEKKEIEIITAFLPAQMDDEAVKAAIQEAIAATGASSMKDMGKVMGILRGKYAGQMDFGKASGLIKSLLG